MDDIFNKIINREVPAEIIYEDDKVISFLDIKPVNKGHVLVVPKKKFRNIFDADPVVFAHMATVAQKVAVALKEVTGADGANLVMNNERAAGQDVFHAHLHIFPRYENDGAFPPSKHVTYDDGEMATVAERVRNALA